MSFFAGSTWEVTHKEEKPSQGHRLLCKSMGIKISSPLFSEGDAVPDVMKNRDRFYCGGRSNSRLSVTQELYALQENLRFSLQFDSLT
jgi:hypothetical protein